MSFEIIQMKQLIEKALKEHAPKKAKMVNDYEKYKGNADIFTRQLPLQNDFDKQINHDFFGYIVDQAVGYLWGNPITYMISKELISEIEYERFVNEFKSFRKRANVEDLDAETGKMMGICGYGSRLVHVDIEGKENVVNVNSWESYFPLDKFQNQYAIRYYDEIIIEENKEVIYTKIEFYDNTFITYFLRKSNGEIVVDTRTEEKPQRPHLFDFVPLIEYPNNKERMNDFDKVKEKINAYDETVSDVQSEIEQFRLAILALYGGNLTKEQKEHLKQTGMISGLKPDSRLEYVIKNINDTFIMNQKSGLKEDIFLFANRVNFTDENFAGNSSGVALEYKLLALENDCIKKERKFTASQRRLFKVLSSSWRKKGKFTVNEDMIEWNFSRNLPIDLLYQAQIAQQLKGFVSEDTRLSKLEIVQDVDLEKRKMQEDLETGMNFDLEGDE